MKTFCCFSYLNVWYAQTILQRSGGCWRITNIFRETVPETKNVLQSYDETRRNKQVKTEAYAQPSLVYLKWEPQG